MKKYLIISFATCIFVCLGFVVYSFSLDSKLPDLKEKARQEISKLETERLSKLEEVRFKQEKLDELSGQIVQLKSESNDIKKQQDQIKCKDLLLEDACFLDFTQEQSSLKEDINTSGYTTQQQ